MNTLQIKVQNKVATYIVRGGSIVCGNSDYQIQFLFDAEWEEHEAKTARFEWNDTYRDVEFTGNICPVPVISNTELCKVGVYVGESPEDGAIISSTRTQIPCQRSIRCGAPLPSPDTGEHYTNEARGYAAEAKASAEVAEEAIAHLGDYMKKVGELETSMSFNADDGKILSIGGLGSFFGNSCTISGDSFLLKCKLSQIQMVVTESENDAYKVGDVLLCETITQIVNDETEMPSNSTYLACRFSSEELKYFLHISDAFVDSARATMLGMLDGITARLFITAYN